MVSEANVDSNKIQNENTKTESAIDEITVVKINEILSLITVQLKRKNRRHTRKW